MSAITSQEVSLIITGCLVAMALIALTFLAFEGTITSDAIVGIYAGVISGGVGFIVGKKN